VNTRIVQAQITGSIIGTTLLFFGISALVGGLGRVRQTFNQASAGLLSTLLFVVVVAILLPAVFDLTERVAAPGMNTSLIDERLSLGVSVVLLLLYAANLIYTLVTHRAIFAGEAAGGRAEWSASRALVVMTAVTAVIAIQSELVSDALEATSSQLGLSPVFLGAVVLALVGTVSDLFAAVVFARQDKMDIVFTICLGSAIQTALVVAPVLVLASWFIGQPMNLVFSSPLDLFAIAGAAFIVRSVGMDGETRWFERLCWSGSICCSRSPTISQARFDAHDRAGSLPDGRHVSRHRCRFPLPAACSCVPKRRQKSGPRRSSGSAHSLARSGRHRRCGKTSVRRSRRSPSHSI